MGQTLGTPCASVGSRNPEWRRSALKSEVAIAHSAPERSGMVSQTPGRQQPQGFPERPLGFGHWGVRSVLPVPGLRYRRYPRGADDPVPSLSLSLPRKSHSPDPGRPWCSSPVSVFRGLCENQSRMDRYRYFIFNQRNMVVLGMFQIALSTVCVTSGFIDGIFRTESQLGKTRAPIWAGMVNLYCIFYALFCSVIFFPHCYLLVLILGVGGKPGFLASSSLVLCFEFS